MSRIDKHIHPSVCRYVRAGAKNFQIKLNATVQRDATGLPQVQVLSCEAAVSTLNIQIGGGVIQWIVNLFNGAIAGKLQTLIQTSACAAAQDALVKYANAKLR